MAEDSVADSERQEKIRAIAHRIWEETGRHTDQAKLHWTMAEKEVEESEQAEAPPSAAEPTADRPDEKLRGRQIEIARKLVGWSRAELAEAASMTEETVATIEDGGNAVPHQQLLSLRRTLEERGVEFPDHETVRLTGTPPSTDHNSSDNPSHE